MSKEAARVPDEEFVLRRIHRNQVEAGPPTVIGFTGFRPTPGDKTGLSVFRERLISSAEVAARGRKPGEYYGVRLPVEALRDLGVTVVVDDEPEAPTSHALLPELSLEAFKEDKVKLREIQVRLAELASQQIVHYPDPFPR